MGGVARRHRTGGLDNAKHTGCGGSGWWRIWITPTPAPPDARTWPRVRGKRLRPHRGGYPHPKKFQQPPQPPWRPPRGVVAVMGGWTGLHQQVGRPDTGLKTVAASRFDPVTRASGRWDGRIGRKWTRGRGDQATAGRTRQRSGPLRAPPPSGRLNDDTVAG